MLHTNTRHTVRVSQILRIANAIAQDLGTPQITTEQFLFAMAYRNPGVGGMAVIALKGNRRIFAEPFPINGNNVYGKEHPKRPIEDYGCTEELGAIFNSAPAEAEKMGHNYVGSEHILLAILASPSPTRDRLHAVGIDYDAAKRQIERLLGPDLS